MQDKVVRQSVRWTVRERQEVMVITSLHIRNFKAWADTGDLRLAPVTVLFGTNSSGKTSLLQFLLMLKQTTESLDRKAPLQISKGPTDYVDLGTYSSLVFNHDLTRQLEFRLSWILPEGEEFVLHSTHQRNPFVFECRIRFENENPVVERYAYRTDGGNFEWRPPTDKNDYSNFSHPEWLRRKPGRPWHLQPPVKCYGFPPELETHYQLQADQRDDSSPLDLPLQFESLFDRVYYVGPLREYPKPIYTWTGQRPNNVGVRGEMAVDAMVAEAVNGQPARARKRKGIVEEVNQWLRRFAMVENVRLSPLRRGDRHFQLTVRTAGGACDVLVTDVGFGVSQLLPIVVQSYLVPEGATILLEQPEIHLHPSVQAMLGDLFTEVSKKRSIQYIIESHSEHLLRRLQRNFADTRLVKGDAELYFCTNSPDGARAEQIRVDQYGNIENWPENFFGNVADDLMRVALARCNREQPQ